MQHAERAGQIIATTVVVFAAATVAALFLNTTTPIPFIENLTYDLRVTGGAPAAQAQFAIVKIDGDATKAMSEVSACHCLAPIDKAWLGDLIATLDSKGVKVIAVDYLLDTLSSPEEFADFGRRIENVKAPIIVAADPGMKAGVDFPVSAKLHYADARALMHTDYDDVIRKYGPNPSQYRALATEVGVLANQMKPQTAPFDIRYRKPDLTVSAENAGSISPTFSAAYVSVLPAALLKDKIVFIGSVTRSATADLDTLKEDMHATPMHFLTGHQQWTPGVEVHVHALSQMLAGDKIRRPGEVWVAIIILSTALAGALLGHSTQKWWTSVSTVLVMMGVTSFVTFELYLQATLMVPMTAPAVSFAFGFFILSRLAAADLQNQRAFYSSTLERYLAPKVIDRVVDGREEVKIGAEEREITVMITDLENFSNLVASLDLETFEGVINEYFDGIIDLLWKHEAMIDKMTGDGVTAIFGAPEPSEDHADRAIACAREIDTYALAIREKMLTRGISFGYTRMGLSSGIGLVGNFGGERRFNYTAYGEV